MKILITAMAAMAETAGPVSRSFDEVLLLTGNLNYQYLKKSVESEEYNPLVLIVIAVPSIVWSFILKNKEKYKDISYFDFYTEKWANHLGELVSGRKSMERIDV